MRRKILGVLPAILLLSMIQMLGCSSEKSSRHGAGYTDDAVSPLLAVVSIVPQAYFVERIGGSLVDVSVLSPPDHSPETYQVTPRQMDLLGRADVFFRIGMPFEVTLVERLAASCPQLTLVDTREGVPMLTMDGHLHHHDQDDAHGHACSIDGDDPHIWLDPMRVRIQARTMAEALVALAPQHEPAFRQGLASFESELEALHLRLEDILAPVRGKTMYVFHPAFGYLADAYGFSQRAIEHEGKSPGPRRLYALIEEIKAVNATAIFDQPQFASREVYIIAAETGAQVVLIDNLAQDYMENMEAIARTIAAHL